MVTDTYVIPITPFVSIVTLEEAKQHLRIEADVTEEDTLIQSYIDSAQIVCENFINRAVGLRKFAIKLDGFSLPITYEGSSNDSVEKIEYYAPGETIVSELDSDKFTFRKSVTIDCFDVRFKELTPTDIRPDAVLITINQGYDATTVPAPIKQAILLLVGDFYERREDREQGTNPATSNLLRPYRRY